MTDLILEPQTLAAKDCPFCVVDGVPTGEMRCGNASVLCVCIKDKHLRKILRDNRALKQQTREAYEDERRQERRVAKIRMALTVLAAAALLLALKVAL